MQMESYAIPSSVQLYIYGLCEANAHVYHLVSIIIIIQVPISIGGTQNSTGAYIIIMACLQALNNLLVWQSSCESDHLL